MGKKINELSPYTYLNAGRKAYEKTMDANLPKGKREIKRRQALALTSHGEQKLRDKHGLSISDENNYMNNKLTDMTRKTLKSGDSFAKDYDRWKKGDYIYKNGKYHITESQLHRVIKESVQKVLREEYYNGDDLLDEPLEIDESMYLVNLKFNDEEHGEASLSFDYGEEDCDAFWADFEINADRLDVLLHSKYRGDRVSIDSNEAARCVTFTNNFGYVTNSPEADLRLKRTIIKLYAEAFGIR